MLKGLQLLQKGRTFDGSRRSRVDARVKHGGEVQRVRPTERISIFTGRKVFDRYLR